MPKDDDVISLEPIEASWGNQVVRDKLVQRAANSADLAASWPAPQDGEMVWQQDTNRLYVWDGTEWVLHPNWDLVNARLIRAGDAMTGTLEAIAGDNAIVNLTFDSSVWIATQSSLQCWKDSGGTVHLKGRPVNQYPEEIPEPNITTLPVGYRPAEQQRFTVANEAKGIGYRLDVATNGEVAFDDSVNLPGIWFDLAGVSFWVGW